MEKRAVQPAAAESNPAAKAGCFVEKKPWHVCAFEIRTRLFESVFDFLVKFEHIVVDFLRGELV